MSDFVFVSPGVKFRERDLSFVIRNVGLTTLGLVGETQKGPAFEPIPVADKNEFRKKFGRRSTEKIGNDLKYHLPYVADSYLSESNQLFVTRVLGLSGYDAGKGWALTVSSGLDPTTLDNGTSVTGTTNFTGSIYSGVTISATGTTGTIEPNYVRTNDVFEGTETIFYVDTYDGITGAGIVSFTATTFTGSPYTDVDNMVVGVLRSRANYIVEDLQFIATAVTITESSYVVNDLSESFTISASGSSITEDYTVSLINTSRDYIVNVLGDKPKSKNTMLYVESIYPQLIKKLLAEGRLYGLNTSLVGLDTNIFSDYKEQYTTPETPWIVSELRGTTVERLFRFISISDGSSANKEIKISIQNIDPISREFDVIIRDFNDTDDNVSVIESFTRCSFNPNVNGYIGKRIGTLDSRYELRSSYVMLEINESASIDSFPAGFEGYSLRGYSATNTGTSALVAPQLLFKTEYTNTDKIRKTYLGISEKAFDTSTSTGNKLDQNLFNYFGKNRTGSSLIKTKGFHMDSNATSSEYLDGLYSLGSFEVGDGVFQAIEVGEPESPYYDKLSRKFTFVPFGGFDGWDEHRIKRTNTELYKDGGVSYFANSDYFAYLNGIKTFDNPEQITINLFATPGLNFSDHITLLTEAIDMIENERGDSLYIIDAPDASASVTETYSTDIVGLLDTTSIDSSYSATFAPWIEIDDTDNATRVFIPPTGEVVKAIAFTDKTKYPWFAPAGLTRGVTSARRARKSLKTSERDILYAGRINPLTTFPNVGVAIFGQKTLQIRESLLDRINVRRMLLEVRKLVSNVAVRLVFEQNDQVVRDEFITKVTPILDNIRRERGLFDFRVIMDETLNTPESVDRNELYGEILLKPIAAVEFIGIGFTITPSGASFDNI